MLSLISLECFCPISFFAPCMPEAESTSSRVTNDSRIPTSILANASKHVEELSINPPHLTMASRLTKSAVGE